ncbi:hypothetical protein B0A52_07377 [Exophiala mesophila]|uniref:FAD/NAD(P)-binding domain-containing protein n=1 Tax=Exophiala mesophila TaxID=212818 RepID=A0A438MXE9_EXOME|nr:hypothetical protein B0A52_07377 [Exophiala mesophila]
MAVDVPIKYVLQSLPCSLPVARFDASVDVESIAIPFIDSLEQLVPDVLATNPVWRDLFALTGTLRTIYSADSITTAWTKTRTLRGAQGFKLIPDSGAIVRPNSTIGWIQLAFTFSVSRPPAAECRGFLTLVLDQDGDWKIWTIRTILEQLVGCPNVDFLPTVPAGVLNGTSTSSLNPQATIVNGTTPLPNQGGVDQEEPLSVDYDVVIVGGGQAGLGTAGRLQALNIRYVVLETHEHVGDNWATRYESARLHTPRDYNHLPFSRTFDPSYQDFLDKYDLVKGYQHYVRTFGIEKNIQFQSTLTGGSWNADRRIWTLRVSKLGSEQILTCRHVVIAVGGGGQTPLMPDFPGRKEFHGEVLHSVDYRSADQWRGKSTIVVGTANTAHDVAADMVDAGLESVTMVQRNRTYVLPAEYYKIISERTYNGKTPIEDADRAQYSQVTAISRLLSMDALNTMASKEPERFDALEKVGFKVERYGDIIYQLTEKLGGHYMDVGCSTKIAQGQIRIKSDSLATHFTSNGLAFADGSEIAADVIVFCTGFRGNMRTNVEELFGKEISAQVDDFYGLDAEGELKGAFKPTGHPGLWYMGGPIGHSRYFSRHVALQIKADLTGTPMPIYQGQRRSEKDKG